MKVLFSPIGSTDPISNYRDGGMLHICRHYRPDKVYLYISKEMCMYHDLDDRYQAAIRMLGKEIGWNFEIVTICDREMEHVQLFDAFINMFEQSIDRIRQEDKPDEILVNVSSGTPAMKSSLQMISMLWNDVSAVQVSTPAKSSNKNHEDKDDYDLEVQWELNEDREDGVENRCIISDAHHLLDRIKKENIQNYIQVYEYEAAKMMAETLYQKPSKQFFACLDIAIARQKLNIKYVNMNRKNYPIDDWFPIVEERAMKEYEYLLSMQNRLKKKEYVDFIRGITPIFFSISEKIMKKYTNLTFSDIGEQRREVWFLSMDKLNEQKITLKKNWGYNTFIGSNVILEILKFKLEESSEVVTLMNEIKEVENCVRNPAAHEIMGMTDELIKRRTKYSSEEILNMLFKLAKLADMNISKDNRQIYEVMNQGLIKMLNVND